MHSNNVWSFIIFSLWYTISELNDDNPRLINYLYLRLGTNKFQDTTKHVVINRCYHIKHISYTPM